VSSLFDFDDQAAGEALLILISSKIAIRIAGFCGLGKIVAVSPRRSSFGYSVPRRRADGDDLSYTNDPDCLFCRQRDSRVAGENGTCYARFDNFPASRGHIEIVPKRHVESLFDLTREEVADALALLFSVQAGLRNDYGPDGYTIGINEGEAAGQSIPHLHIHLIPRYWGDVEDPRGGIRRIVPNFDPDAWIAGAAKD
jgi:diadenosine tetraphosphate (Ap4A) HIT family hydrolase